MYASCLIFPYIKSLRFEVTDLLDLRTIYQAKNMAAGSLAKNEDFF